MLISRPNFEEARVVLTFVVLLALYLYYTASLYSKYVMPLVFCVCFACFIPECVVVYSSEWLSCPSWMEPGTLQTR